jgi:all-trans-retinol 13,14-reductase
MLSKWGYRTLVLEHDSLVGGYCRSFERDGFTFNIGGTEMTGLWEDGPIDLFLKELRLKKEDFFVLNSYTYKLGEIETKPYGGVQEILDQLSNLFSDEVENLSAFFMDAQKAHDEWYKDTSVYGAPLPPELIVKVFGEKGFRDQLKSKPYFYDWYSKSWKQKLDEFFTSDDLKELLDFLMNYTSIEPAKTPPEVPLRSFGDYHNGNFHPKGGTQKLVDAIKEFIESHGGRVLVNHEVSKILMENGQVTGVRAGDKIFKSNVVASNASIKNTLLNMVDPSSLEDDFRASIEALKIKRTYFMVFLGVDMDLSDYPTTIRVMDDEEDQFYALAIHSNADPRMAPEGKASITIRTPTSYDEFPARGAKDYLKKKEAYAARLIKMAEKVIPGLGQHIILQDAATPKTLERYTLAPEGSGEGFFWSTEVERPCFKTPVRGLYLVGSSTFPGAGVELSLMSGVICANDINGW